jgi:hypothetical protein
VSTETSLGMAPEARLPTAIAGLETFTLGGNDDEEEDDDPRGKDVRDADSFFNLPAGGSDDDED